VHYKELKIHDGICGVCAVVAATLILPALAFADPDNERGNKDKGNKEIVEIPQDNPMWALIPFFSAVLLYSWRRFSRA
jgi:hypothetical protein